jgi:hypothetical protein
MSKKALLLAVLFVFVILPGPAQAASPAGSGTFAHAWTNYSDKEHRAFIFGLATAVRIMCMDLTTTQKDATPQTIEKNFRDCFNSYAGIEPEKVIAAMNALYADSKNSMIPLDGMYKIALMKVRGDKVDDILAQSRKYGEKLKKELDQRRSQGQ